MDDRAEPPAILSSLFCENPNGSPIATAAAPVPSNFNISRRRMVLDMKLLIG